MYKPLAAIALAAALGGGVALAATAPAFHSPRVALPYPGPHFAGQGAVLLNRDCSTCHSADFVNGQPHLALATWKMEVAKMKNVFHAKIADQDIDPLAQALFARHPAPK